MLGQRALIRRGLVVKRTMPRSTIHSPGEKFTRLWCIPRNIVGNASVLIRHYLSWAVLLPNLETRGSRLWLRISTCIAEYYQIWVVPEFLVSYRQVTGNISENISQCQSLYSKIVQRFSNDIRNSQCYYWWSNSFFFTYQEKSSGCSIGVL